MNKIKGRSYSLEGKVLRRDTNVDDEIITYKVNDDGTENWNITSINRNKKRSISVSYKDYSDCILDLNGKPYIIDFCHLMDLVSLVIGIDIMKKKYDKTQLREKIKIVDVRLHDNKLLELKEAFPDLSHEKLVKIIDMVNSK